MATCPQGHQTAATDFCDVCGMRVGVGPSPAVQRSASVRETTAAWVLPQQRCPNCGSAQAGRFCQTCGRALSTARPTVPVRPAPDAAYAGNEGAAGASLPAGWQRATGGLTRPDPAPAPLSFAAVVSADRAYAATVMSAGGPDADSIGFPAHCPPRLYQLIGPEMQIGRRSAARGLAPEIDLTGPPADLGVSHLHAVLTAEADGTWTVMDLGSSNGTQLNRTKLARGMRVPLRVGDRICLGGWTAVTILAG